jgi:hypothetical protein
MPRVGLWRSILVVSFTLIALMTRADGLKELGGIFSASYGFFVDGSADGDSADPADSVRFYFEGDAARNIYNAMPQKAEVPCGSDPLLKYAGGLICGKHEDGQYDCSVGIVLKTGETTAAVVC